MKSCPDNTMKGKHLKKHWVVVYTRHRCEKKLYASLVNQGIETFLPLYSTVRQWSDRKKKLELPLLNSMVFIKTNVCELRNIYKIPLVTGVLKEFGKPGIVHDEEIRNLKIIAREWNGKNIRACKADQYTPGDYVRVKRGNFRGLTGWLTEIKGRYRLVMELSAINTSFVINLPASQVEKIAPKRELQVS
ncbi:MAG: UpxY family transcription antiterminator [Candidatus Delongbacteria bacterium]|jgi:transcription antitermination factor NusG|nr:UpxY family transcription antiterminator [Candidatus Delongbacteria bacterium]